MTRNIDRLLMLPQNEELNKAMKLQTVLDQLELDLTKLVTSSQLMKERRLNNEQMIIILNPIQND